MSPFFGTGIRYDTPGGRDTGASDSMPWLLSRLTTTRRPDGLSAWELACHALPTTVFAAQSLFGVNDARISPAADIRLVRECPLQTASDRGVGRNGHADGAVSGLRLVRD
jgi:hypothetical protein